MDWQYPNIEGDFEIRLQESTNVYSKDFLGFAKEDLQSNCLKGSINAITNAKRAIDCCIDNLILSLGYHYKKMMGNTKLLEFVKNQKNHNPISIPI